MTSNIMMLNILILDLQKLQSLGFSEEDCVKALLANLGGVDNAALWLTKNATVQSEDTNTKALHISGFEIKAGGICFCLIDDCLDADVPLAELTFSSKLSVCDKTLKLSYMHTVMVYMSRGSQGKMGH